MTHAATKLEPCPWCGRRPRVLKGRRAITGGGSHWPAEVKCVSERCPVRPLVEREWPADAVAAWNRRATPEQPR